MLRMETECKNLVVCGAKGEQSTEAGETSIEDLIRTTLHRRAGSNPVYVPGRDFMTMVSPGKAPGTRGNLEQMAHCAGAGAELWKAAPDSV